MGELSRPARHPSHEMAKILPRWLGALLTFGIKGPWAGQAFYRLAENLLAVANIGDAKSLVIHPASTTWQLTEAEQLETGVSGD